MKAISKENKKNDMKNILLFLLFILFIASTIIGPMIYKKNQEIELKNKIETPKKENINKIDKIIKGEGLNTL